MTSRDFSLFTVGSMTLAVCSAGFTYTQTKHLLRASGLWGPPKVKNKYHKASEIRRTRSRGGLATRAMPGGPQGVGSYVAIR